MNISERRIINPNGANIVFRHRISRSTPLMVLLQKSATRTCNGWELPGGGIEYGLGESFLQAALRECEEEIGISVDPCTLAMEAVFQQRVVKPELPDAYIIGTVTLFSAYSEVDIQTLVLQPNEVSEVRWWNIEDALRAQDDGRGDFVLLAPRRMLAAYYNRVNLDMTSPLSKLDPYSADLIQPIQVVLEDGTCIDV